MLCELEYTGDKTPLFQGAVQNFNFTLPYPSRSTSPLSNEDVEKWLNALGQIQPALSGAGYQVQSSLVKEDIEDIVEAQRQLLQIDPQQMLQESRLKDVISVYQKIDQLPNLIKNSLLSEKLIEVSVLELAKKFVERFYRLLVQRGVNSRHIYAARALPFVVHLKGFAIVLL